MNNLEYLLGYRNLTPAIQSPVGGLPAGFPAAFLNLTRPRNGVTFQYSITPSTRQTSAIVPHGAPSVHVNNQQKSTRGGVMIHTFENQSFGQDVMTSLMGPDGNLDDLGRSELARQTKDFARRFDNTRIHAVQSVLALGKIFKKGTALLPSSSGSTETIDLGVPATNQGLATNILGTGLTWDNASALIATQVEGLQQKQVQNGNPPLRYALYGAGLLDFLASNAAIAKMITGSSDLANGFAKGIIPDLYGLTWIPMVGQFFQSADGVTNTSMFSKLVTFCPEPTRDWYEMNEGSYAVPRDVVLNTDAATLAEIFSTVRGKFSFAEVTTNPPGITQYAGDTFLPTLYVPNAIWQMQVLP